MRNSKEIIGKPVISIDEGRQLGTVRDLYVDRALGSLAGVHLGREGLLSRKSLLIRSEDITIFGIDAVLVQRSDVITDNKQVPESSSWMRLDDLAGRQVDTPAGTRIGTIGDVVLDDLGRIAGFALSRVQVTGPLADHPVIPNEAIFDMGHEDQVMTIDLALAEKHSLRAMGKYVEDEVEEIAPAAIEEVAIVEPVEVDVDESVEPAEDAGMGAAG